MSNKEKLAMRQRLYGSRIELFSTDMEARAEAKRNYGLSFAALDADGAFDASTPVLNKIERSVERRAPRDGV